MRPLNADIPRRGCNFFTMHAKKNPCPICHILGTTLPRHNVNLLITFHILCIDRFVFRIWHLYILILILVRTIVIWNFFIILILIVLSRFGIGI
jgi:hypothetical protein